MVTVTILMLHMEKLRLREAKCSATGHGAASGEGELDPGLSDSRAQGWSSTIGLVFAEAVGSGSEEQKEVSAHSSSLGPQADQKPSVWHAGAVRSWVDGEQRRGVMAWRGRKPSLAMPTPSRKHACLFGQAVGRGQLCGVPTATNRRWFLRAEGKQLPWLLGYAPG